MTETIGSMPAVMDQQRLAQDIVEQVWAEGVRSSARTVCSPGLTKRVLESALEPEMSEHLGYDKHDAACRNGARSRNGTRTEALITAIGPVEIEVPRDRDSSFQPVIVRKRQRRLDGIDQIVLSLTARGLTTGEVSAHFAKVYGASVGKDTISRITESGDRGDCETLRPATAYLNQPRDGAAVGALTAAGLFSSGTRMPPVDLRT